MLIRGQVERQSCSTDRGRELQRALVNGDRLPERRVQLLGIEGCAEPRQDLGQSVGEVRPADQGRCFQVVHRPHEVGSPIAEPPLDLGSPTGPTDVLKHAVDVQQQVLDRRHSTPCRRTPSR